MLKTFFIISLVELFISLVNIGLDAVFDMPTKRCENDFNFAVESVGILFFSYILFYSNIISIWLPTYTKFQNLFTTLSSLGFGKSLFILILGIIGFVVPVILLAGSINKTKNVLKLNKKLKEEYEHIY